MPRVLVLSILATVVLWAHVAFAAVPRKGVQVVADEEHRRVEITIDGEPFTSYIWPTSLKKPVLYPLITEDGVTVTRGFPLEPRPGERIDHPHHAGLWFNYGNVNGFDFWNNSDAIPPEDHTKMGSILHTRVVSTTSGLDRGELVVESAWITGKNQRVLNEQTSYVFERHANSRTIDMSVTLKALDRVVFIDDKEGLLGMRVARWLESPDEKGGVVTDANGNATKVDAAADANSGPNPATGVYLTSEGAKGGAAWGTRGRWCALTGHTGSHTVTIAIFDHPRNPGYPTYWHARGYGLFAANPLGRNIFDPKQPSFNYTLEKDQSVTFSYRIDLLSGAAVSSDLDRESSAFAAKSR